MKPRAILVVEPDPDELAGTLKLFEDAGHQTRGVSTFREAKQQMALELPDLLITNVRLGAFNGLQLVLRTAFHHPETAAIVIDRHPDPGLAAEAHRHGAAYLFQPSPAQLLAAAATQEPIGQHIGFANAQRSNFRVTKKF